MMRMTTPAEKLIALLMDMKFSPDIDTSARRDVDMLIKAVASQTLYKLDFDQFTPGTRLQRHVAKSLQPIHTPESPIRPREQTNVLHSLGMSTVANRAPDVTAETKQGNGEEDGEPPLSAEQVAQVTQAGIKHYLVDEYGAHMHSDPVRQARNRRNAHSRAKTMGEVPSLQTRPAT